MTVAYIGLGANLSQPQQKIRQALDEIKNHRDLQLLTCSSLYQSAPMGLADQPNYINAVAKLSTTLSPHSLLDTLLNIETTLGRTRDGTRWGPRVIDIDLLYYGDHIINENKLTLPHPEINNRNFVLYPLAEIEPDFVFPDGQLLSKLLDKAPPNELERIASV
ncbi:MAG: 2-amino-4-hydroxy-6-hydroxymethyldihydropteridine diphosphokinase [Pseudomonadales bacterium]|nr:2-amino-4-hydroxy-6-hydroxymethyldihydropteridine diphosphokinase [Pseudomonadales bacterium]